MLSTFSFLSYRTYIKWGNSLPHFENGQLSIIVEKTTQKFAISYFENIGFVCNPTAIFYRLLNRNSATKTYSFNKAMSATAFI